MSARNFHEEVREGAEKVGIRVPGFKLSIGNALVFDRESRRIRLVKRGLLPEDDIAFRFAGGLR